MRECHVDKHIKVAKCFMVQFFIVFFRGIAYFSPDEWNEFPFFGRVCVV